MRRVQSLFFWPSLQKGQRLETFGFTFHLPSSLGSETQQFARNCHVDTHLYISGVLTITSVRHVKLRTKAVTYISVHQIHPILTALTLTSMKSCKMARMVGSWSVELWPRASGNRRIFWPATSQVWVESVDRTVIGLYLHKI